MINSDHEACKYALLIVACVNNVGVMYKRVVRVESICWCVWRSVRIDEEKWEAV